MTKFRLLVYQDALLFLENEQFCNEIFDTRAEAEARADEIRRTVNNYRDVFLIEEFEVDE